MKLVDTNFKVLIEFDGKKGVRRQRFSDVRKFVSDNQKPYIEYYVKQILSQDRRKRIYKGLQTDKIGIK